MQNKTFEFYVLSGVVLAAKQHVIWIEDNQGFEHELENTHDVPVRLGENVSEFKLHHEGKTFWYAIYKKNSKHYKYSPAVLTENREYLFGYVAKEFFKLANQNLICLMVAFGLIPLFVLTYFLSRQPNVEENKAINAHIESIFLKLIQEQ